MSKKKKVKKEKITYIDDGCTIVDMTGVTGKKSAGGSETKQMSGNGSKPAAGLRYRASLKEQADTFFAAMKMMFVPMLVVICGIIIIYMLLSLLFLIM